MTYRAHQMNRLTEERDVLMFYRDNSFRRSQPENRESGATRRFYRHIYPATAIDHRSQADWLEVLVERNSWLK